MLYYRGVLLSLVSDMSALPSLCTYMQARVTL